MARISGTDNDNLLVSGPGGNVIHGLVGNDAISGTGCEEGLETSNGLGSLSEAADRHKIWCGTVLNQVATVLCHSIGGTRHPDFPAVEVTARSSNSTSTIW